MGEFLTTHINGDENPANLLMKVIWREKTRYILNIILFDVYNGEFEPYAVAEWASMPKPSTRACDTWGD